MRRAGDTAALRSAGETLGREGLAKRVVELIDSFQQQPSYINAIVLAGRLSAIATACRWDDYWHEKSEIGFHKEMHNLADMQSTALRERDKAGATP